jgi:hypothetical protein
MPTPALVMVCWPVRILRLRPPEATVTGRGRAGEHHGDGRSTMVTGDAAVRGEHHGARDQLAARDPSELCLTTSEARSG